MIQDTTFQQIWTRHVSKHELEALPEQETNTPKANPRAIDKWAQEVTHRPKGKVGGPTRRPADQPGRPSSPWAPPPSGSTWRSPIGCLCQFDEAWLQLTPWLPPINTKGGRGMNTHISPSQLTLPPLELEAFILDA